MTTLHEPVANAVDYAVWQGEHTTNGRVPVLPRFEVASEDALMELPPLSYLDRDLGMIAGGFHLIYGASGSGKTFFAIERALRQVSLDKRVLYIATEDLQGLRYRVSAWRKAHPEASGRLTWLKTPDGLDLQNPEHVAALLSAIQPYEYDLIVLDTLREAHSGDENSSRDTSVINRALQRIISTGAAVDVVHHSGVAGERPRGSTALFGNADVVIKVENDDGFIRVSYDKMRNAPPRDALAFGLVSQDTGLLDADDQPVISAILRTANQVTLRNVTLTPNYRRVLEALAMSIFDGVGAKAQQIVDTVDLPKRTIYRALDALKRRDFISQGLKGDPYYITPAGRAQLGPDLSPAPAGDTYDKAAGSASVTSDTAVSPKDTDTPVTPVSVSPSVTTLKSDTGDTRVTPLAQSKIPLAAGPGARAAMSRRAALADEYERLIGPLTTTMTLDELDDAVSAARGATA